MMKQKLFSGFVVILAVMIAAIPSAWAQSGKISGTVVDAQTGEPLPGANVTIVGTTMGAAASLEGDFYILNVPPGVYDVRASFMGYDTELRKQVQVNVNRTTEINFRLRQSVIEGKEVVVEASKIAQKKDQTSSVRNVSSET
ncbi:MAG: carboxypeptidase-like regulatory domain-containing protein, partial [candidate division KSB1 bacterium]|nr:carboxypeptidase-like regulatory domain-containing protein [candidate division KSB1 bacterium]